MREDMTDEEHIRFMLDGGTRGRIEKLYKTEDALGFGGGLWLHHQLPVFKDGYGADDARVWPLRRRSEFYTSKFAFETASGFAVWFRRGADPLRPMSRANRTLCGWVPLDREAEINGWIEELNRTIQGNLDRAGAPSADEERNAAAKVHMQGSIGMLRGLGLQVPEAETMDELVTKLAEANEDGPIDLRGKNGDGIKPENG